MTRIRCGWGKFRELLQVLTSKRFSLRRRGNLYAACVRSVILHGSETLAVKQEDTDRLERADRAMIRWICGVPLGDMVPSLVLSGRLGLKSIAEVMRDKRLRWFGHVERSGEDSWISKCRDIKVEGAGKRGRPPISWGEVLRKDLRERSISPSSVGDRDRWRAACK